MKSISARRPVERITQCRRREGGTKMTQTKPRCARNIANENSKGINQYWWAQKETWNCRGDAIISRDENDSPHAAKCIRLDDLWDTRAEQLPKMEGKSRWRAWEEMKCFGWQVLIMKPTSRKYASTPPSLKKVIIPSKVAKSSTDVLRTFAE